ncbi:WD40-repeat-containing domain protein [Suillus discolor]|uniref:WD40-repeat-containing domain protein n=1 Tax=Suillus discolor TaxID=1912936 RepID=A0A9P7F293_9AGAM|nr:WD40-repeat-containing domain protein [Suillus discolor]KAG2104099.1 WD40-repeat-containing domain protein [Suillus discolor]
MPHNIIGGATGSNCDSVRRILRKVQSGLNSLFTDSRKGAHNAPPVSAASDGHASSTSNTGADPKSAPRDAQLDVSPVSVAPPSDGHTPSTSNTEADPKSALRDAQQGGDSMVPLSGPATTAASVGQGAQGDLDTAGNFQDTYLKPLRIFDDVIGQIADLHPYAKIALGVLTGLVHSVSFSMDGTCIAACSNDCTIQLWDLATGKPVGEPFLGHTEPVTSVSSSPDGTLLATALKDSTIRVWDRATGKTVGEPFLGHTGPVTSASFSSDSTLLATASNDKTIRVWDRATGKTVFSALAPTSRLSIAILIFQRSWY